MPAVARYQVGAKDQVDYDTQIVVDRFWRFVSNSIKPIHARVPSASMGGHVAQRNDLEMPYKVGAAGSVAFEVHTKGFGWWLKHLLGTVGTAGPSGDGAYTHTGTFGTHKGDAFTFQSNEPFHPADTDQAFTYLGGKVLKWKFSCAVGQPLKLELELDFKDYTTGTALAAASYASAAHLLTFVGGAVTIGGAAVDIKSIEVECDNGFDVGQDMYQRASTLKLEPQQRKMREVSWKLGLDWIDLTQHNRFASATLAGALAQIVATWTGPVLIGGATFPSLALTIDEARFDDIAKPIEGPGPLTQEITGSGLYDGSASPVTLAYVTADATP